MANLLPDRWREPLENLQERIGGFLERWRPKRTTTMEPETITSDSMPAFLQAFGPRLDLAETSDGLLLTAEVPGMDKNDIAIELSGKRLTLRGEKKICHDRNEGGVYRSECRYGSFSRTVQLPYQVDENNIKAYLQKGILTVRLARSAESPPTGHKISVT